jgi:hypothetical protein
MMMDLRSAPNDDGYTLGREPLGRGAYGRVYYAEKDSCPYAVKQCDVESKDQQNAILDEAVRLSKLKHEAIVEVYQARIDTVLVQPGVPKEKFRVNVYMNFALAAIYGKRLVVRRSRTWTPWCYFAGLLKRSHIFTPITSSTAT